MRIKINDLELITYSKVLNPTALFDPSQTR